MVTNGLLAVDGLYIVMAVWGLFGGLLPSGLTGFDVVFHVVTGVAALGAGLGRFTKAQHRTAAAQA